MTPEPLHQKYIVTRLNDDKRKHDFCEYFVLDLEHDRHAQAALRAYAESVGTDNPGFASELLDLAGTYDYTDEEDTR